MPLGHQVSHGKYAGSTMRLHNPIAQLLQLLTIDSALKKPGTTQFQFGTCTTVSKLWCVTFHYFRAGFRGTVSGALFPPNFESKEKICDQLQLLDQSRVLDDLSTIGAVYRRRRSAGGSTHAIQNALVGIAFASICGVRTGHSKCEWKPDGSYGRSRILGFQSRFWRQPDLRRDCLERLDRKSVV